MSRNRGRMSVPMVDMALSDVIEQIWTNLGSFPITINGLKLKLTYYFLSLINSNYHAIWLSFQDMIN